MSTSSIVVVGGGFAGLWSALSAARELENRGITPAQVSVMLINRDPWHAIRVRNYENDISTARIPLSSLLQPAGIELVVANMSGIDPTRRRITIERDGKADEISYDRLVIAAGSQLSRPPLPGLAQHAFAIDTWDEAAELDTHLRELAASPASPDAATVLIVGAGLTGIELACELPRRLLGLGIARPRIILADRNSLIGSDMGDQARPIIERALQELGVETLTNCQIASIDQNGAITSDGNRIQALTVVWTAGLVASPVSAMLPLPHDPLGRLRVDTCLRVPGLNGIFAAGDIAAAPTTDGHQTVMSCQHARPMGRYAGHNAVLDLLGAELLPMAIDYYVTCMDLGPWGAIYTRGWDRKVEAAGPEVKQTKTTTNRVRIYPPPSYSRRDLFEAASPMVQMAPAISKAD